MLEKFKSLLHGATIAIANAKKVIVKKFIINKLHTKSNHIICNYTYVSNVATITIF